MTFLLRLIAVTLLFASPALADTSLLATPTKSQTIAFMFYRLANLQPDFATLIQSTPAFQTADTATREKMLREDKGKMEQEFLLLNPKKDIIVVRTGVTLKVDITKPGMTLEIPHNPGGPIYFPYRWGTDNFAIIPNEIEAFLNIPLKMEQASAASTRLDRNGHATMVLELLPRSADSSRPMALDGLNQWLLMTDIASINFYNEFLQTIWSWQAPWYARPSQDPIKGLKKEIKP